MVLGLSVSHDHLLIKKGSMVWHQYLTYIGQIKGKISYKFVACLENVNFNTIIVIQ